MARCRRCPAFQERASLVNLEGEGEEVGPRGPAARLAAGEAKKHRSDKTPREL